MAKHTKSILLLSLSTIVAAEWVSAAEWTTSSGITYRHVYSDNTELSAEDEESRSTSLLTPNFSLQGSGASANVDVSGSLQFSDAGGQADNFNPSVNASADAELIKNFLFIEADASARQTSIDPFGRTGSAGVSNTDNSTTTYQYGITPYISSRIKDYVTYELRYNYDDQINDDSDVDDSTQDSASFNLSGGSYFGRFSWGLGADYRKTEYEDRSGNVSATDNSDNEFISGDVNFGYRFSRKWQLTASVGKEWNDYQSTTGNVDGDTWSTGFVWTPNARITVILGYGERYFGSTPSLDISYRHKKSELSLGYSRSTTDSRGIRAGGRAGTSNLSRFRNLTSRTNSAIIDERLDFSYALSGTRTTLTLDGERSKQTTEDTGVEDIFTGYSLSVDRTLASSMSVSFSYSWDEREDGDTNDVVQTNDYTLSLTKRLGERTNISLDYNHADRDSDRIDDDYVENRISVSVSVSH